MLPWVGADMQGLIDWCVDRLAALACSLYGVALIYMAAAITGFRLTSERRLAIGIGLIGLGALLGMRRAVRRYSEWRRGRSETDE